VNFFTAASLLFDDNEIVNLAPDNGVSFHLFG